ncbi:MAG: phosphonate ABC transporter, permease protein PhnE [Methylobacteriaceae bacterium]|nr:phosphonate ABC transporter, permease protein PhnE [Methylobacteriaceae bacterium]
MASAILRLPEHQAAALVRAYETAQTEKRRKALLGAAVLVACILAAAHFGEVDLKRFFTHIGNFTSYIGRLFFFDSGASVFSDPHEWLWGITQKNRWLPLLGQTLIIAYLGTILGAATGFIASFLAAANLVRSRWLRFVVRRFLEFCRTVPELVFALVFVVAFGLGPLPGVLALAIHTTGALGKLFAEVVENIDMKPVEGIASTGANWVETVRFGAVPQVLSNFVSYTLLRFEINVRTAGVMGFVGAGGIGQELLVNIRQFYYSDVSAVLLLIVVTVAIIDLMTERLRTALLGMEAQK